MTEKIEHPPLEIDGETLRRGTVLSTSSIHLTGGLRAESVQGGWSIHPMSGDKGIGALNPIVRGEVDYFARTVGLKIIGGDEISGSEGALPIRIWKPLDAEGSGKPDPADAWGSISSAASRSGDERVAQIARKIGVTLNAAGIRIRDASDCYHRQLAAALIDNQPLGNRFKNVPLLDLFLAFHSLLSEMASARDYIAEYAGHQLGAPERIDGLARFEEWVGAASRADKAADPLAARLVGSRAPGGPNRWLGDLTDYRNEALHRRPMAVALLENSLVLVERKVGPLTVRLIGMPIPDASSDGAPGDALTIFVALHEKLLELAAFAAEEAPYSTAPPVFTVR